MTLFTKKGSSHGNADALIRRTYDSNIAAIDSNFKATTSETQCSIVDFDPCVVICEITTTPRDELINQQMEDKDFEDIIRYIIDKELPENMKRLGRLL